MLKLPYGITDYKKLREMNYYYIDKTMYLEELENTKDVIVYLRPRRFGKTLLTSMMYYYYDINSEYLFDDLFKETYIFNKPTGNKNNYYILKLDFSGMSKIKTEEEALIKFRNRLTEAIDNFLEHYKNNSLINKNIDYKNEPADILASFITNISLENNKKIYVLIDEYDNFTNAILEDDASLFKKILGKNGFVKDFYARIKEYTASIIDKVFITGVCSISLDSMTSGFNISTNITNLEKFNAMTALTHNEVKTLIDRLDIKAKNHIFKEMVENYDGYKFCKEDSEFVFNPTIVMYYLSNYIEENKNFNLMDPNIISSYEQIKNIIKLGNNETYKDVIDDIFNDKEIINELKDNFEFNNILKRDEIVSLLYYFGCLTIDTGITSLSYKFKIPNKVINKVFSNYYLNMYEEYNVYLVSDKETEVVIELSKDGKVNKLCNYISMLFKNTSNRIYENFREKDLQLFVYAILNRYQEFDVKLEYPSNDNYIDLMIFRKNNSKYNVMLELKYIKKKEYNIILLNKKKKEAINQLNKYIEDDRINKDNLRKYAVIFVGSDIKVLEEII